ncbi:MAG: hypothetical protein JWM02_3618 [Frankiales bacterium]|nr:hypothetical protein [Frankiales bacterium]
MAENLSRVLALLGLLQTHRQWRGSELAARLEVTERTLRRDIDRIRELGYSVAASRGPAGGYRLESGATLPPLLLSEEEAVTMAIGLQLAASEGLDDGQQTALTALAKFEQVLPSAARARVNALGTSVTTAAAGRAAASPALLGQLALACRDGERVRFRYRAHGAEETSRSVEPSSLVAADRGWYLIGWDRDRDAWRTFRLDRISAVFPTGVHFAARPLPAASAAEFLAASVESVQSQVTADVLLRMPLADMREQFASWAVGATRVDDLTTRWPVTARSVPQLAGLLAWIPPSVDYEVVATEEVLAQLRGHAARMARAATSQ